MIVFDELRVTNDAKTLIIDARVRSESYYDDVYIDYIDIDTEETFVEGGPSKNPIYEYTVEEDEKSVRLYVNINDITSIKSFENHLLFVYVVTKGTPTSDVPCGLDEKKTLGVTTYMGDFYNFFMQSIKEMEGNCIIPQGFINALLKWEAVNVSIDSGHYTQGIKYFNQWFKDGGTTVSTITNCGCNG